jgi:hypothetical protein
MKIPPKVKDSGFWFAWFPVKTSYYMHGRRTPKGTIIWLEKIYRIYNTINNKYEYYATGDEL